jgi:hypothetical protein
VRTSETKQSLNIAHGSAVELGRPAHEAIKEGRVLNMKGTDVGVKRFAKSGFPLFRVIVCFVVNRVTVVVNHWDF